MLHVFPLNEESYAFHVISNVPGYQLRGSYVIYKQGSSSVNYTAERGGGG